MWVPVRTESSSHLQRPRPEIELHSSSPSPSSPLLLLLYVLLFLYLSVVDLEILRGGTDMQCSASTQIWMRRPTLFIGLPALAFTCSDRVYRIHRRRIYFSPAKGLVGMKFVVGYIFSLHSFCSNFPLTLLADSTIVLLYIVSLCRGGWNRLLDLVKFPLLILAHHKVCPHSTTVYVQIWHSLLCSMSSHHPHVSHVQSMYCS